MSLPGPRTRYEWTAFSVAGIPVTFSIWYGLAIWATLGRSATLADGLVHLLAVTASVLVHELGHGFAARHYRLKPKILIHGFGGWCEHEAVRRRNDDLVVVAAGPGAGLALGLLGVAAYAVLPWSAPGWARLLAWDLAWMGTAWTALNLLPILPLDGGSLCLNLLERRRSITLPNRLARRIGVFTAALGALLAGWWGELTAVLLLGILGYTNAAELGWVPALPGTATGGPAAPARRWWIPTPAVGAVLATLVVGLGVSSWLDLHALGIREGAAPWVALTWPLAPPRSFVGAASATIAVWLCGPPVERRLGAGGLLALLGVVTATAGVAGLVVADALGGVGPHGPAPLALALGAAWAWRATGGLGPDAVLPVSPRLALAAVLAVDLGDRWARAEPAGATADVVGVIAALVVTGAGDGTMRALGAWWRLRNPPEIRIDRR